MVLEVVELLTEDVVDGVEYADLYGVEDGGYLLYEHWVLQTLASFIYLFNYRHTYSSSP
jgi:hypothetical protein